MARFWVYRLGLDGSLAVDLQANILEGLQTRVVAPLVPVEHVKQLVPRLNPKFDVGGRQMVLLTEFTATVPLKELSDTVMNLSHRADDITAATDFLFQGF